MKRLVLIATVVLASCVQQTAAEEKFVALDQERGYWFGGPPFLIKKVHRQQWRIDYGFADNNACGNKFVGRYGEQLLASVSNTIRVWLGALHEQSNIVDKFNYGLRKTIRQHGRAVMHYGWSEQKPDLAIVFYCHKGRSFMIPKKPFPFVYMLQATDISNHNRMTDLRHYRASTLLHELGHAFGLGDTYVDRSRIAPHLKRYNKSTGGLHSTTGKQPLSVMNHHSHVLGGDGTLRLSDDDRAGMQWLYQRYISKETKRHDCPVGYELEKKTTEGCAPVYPLIHVVKQGNWSSVKTLLKQDKSIDINTQDTQGNTALHYAAQATEGSDLYRYLVIKGANESIRNDNGDSAADLRSEFSKRSLADTVADELQQGAVDYAVWLLHNAVVMRKQIGSSMPQEIINTLAAHANTCGVQEITALHYAATWGYVDLLELLLQRPEVLVNKQCSNGRTALHYAAMAGMEMSVEVLLAHADIDAHLKCTSGETAHSTVLKALSIYKDKPEQSKKYDKYAKVETLLDEFLYPPTQVSEESS